MSLKKLNKVKYKWEKSDCGGRNQVRLMTGIS